MCSHRPGNGRNILSGRKNCTAHISGFRIQSSYPAMLPPIEGRRTTHARTWYRWTLAAIPDLPISFFNLHSQPFPNETTFFQVRQPQSQSRTPTQKAGIRITAARRRRKAGGGGRGTL